MESIEDFFLFAAGFPRIRYGQGPGENRDFFRELNLMKKIWHIFRPPAGADARLSAAHHVWMSAALTGLGCCVGLLALVFSLYIYYPMQEDWLLENFRQNPMFAAMNCLAPVLLIWLFYFIFGRAWAAYLGCALPIGGIAVANYYKIRLRTDPLLASDLRLAFEAGDIAGGYNLTPSYLLKVFLLWLLAGLIFSIVLMPKGIRNWRGRLFGTAACLALIGTAITGPYSSEDVYRRLDNDSLINPWSPTELYLSKGCVYSFLHSGKDLFPTPPAGYRRAEAAAGLAEYPDSAIPDEKKVSVMAFMLEAFCDLTDFDAMAGQEAVQRLYQPWHELEAQSVSGNLLTNIFAGGTVDTEWAFLTGYSTHEDFRSPSGSYVWYLADQGYQTFGSHPGQKWFYNRQNVNQYLGFQSYRFLENYFAPYLTLEGAVRDSDSFLTGVDLEQLKAHLPNGPCFSFSVTYQNHGPYSAEAPEGEVCLTPAGTGLSQADCNILNNYLDGLSRTISAFTNLSQELEKLEEPIVLVLFGDHKPWAGNSGSVYYDMGLSFDLSTRDGFYDYYSTPYLIWANSSAKEVLGEEFTGEGGDFSGCFLMPKLFDLCGWEGPGFMKLARQMREISPLLHVSGRFLKDGALTSQLAPEEQAFYERFLCIQYYREQEFTPHP